MPNYTRYTFDSEQQFKSDEIAGKAKQLEGFIEQNVPMGRERTLALTKLQECVQWCNEGITLLSPGGLPNQ